MVQTVVPEIKSLSSINFRMGRDERERVLKEPIRYKCSYCRQWRRLGAGSSVMVKLMFWLGHVEEVMICGKCIDVFVDIARYGPRVVSEGYKWRLRSRVVRVSLVEGKLLCFRCLGWAKSHVFVKFDDLLYAGKDARYVKMRICSKCAFSFLKMMEKSGVTRNERFMPEDVGVKKVGWHVQAVQR